MGEHTKRVAKHVYDNQTDMLERSTYYILDAQGQQLSMYEHVVDATEVHYQLTERNLYGSSRLGTVKDPVDMYAPDLLPSYGVFGNRNYELNNHLGNVLTVISDHITPLDEDLNEEVDGYQVSLAMVADYSPFGVQLDGRTDENTGYRYGFNGMEIDHQVKGNGNSYTTEFRQYDPCLARWSSIDPLMTKYPFYSPYSTLNNNPLRFTDRLGLEGQDWIGKKDSKGNTTWEWRAEVDGPDKLPPGYTEYAAPYEYSYGVMERDKDGNPQSVRLGDNGKWSYESGTINNQGMPIDNDYTEQGLAAQRLHEKLVANSEALESALTNYALTIATLPLGGLGGAGGKLILSAFLRRGLVQGGVNAISNFGSQLYANQGNFDNIDRISVGLAFGSGFIPGKFGVHGSVATGVADGLFDYTPSYGGNYNIFYNKPVLQVISDASFSTLGNLGANSFGEIPPAFSLISQGVTVLPTTTLNTIVNNQIK